MFQSLRSPSSSPCSSPVREFAATLRRASIPMCGRNRYKSLVGPQKPIVSKGRLTMTGGFTYLRPRTIDRADSLESEGETSSSRCSSRSASCDSCDLESQAAKPARRYFKIPKKALTAAMGRLSPRLRKKLQKAEEVPTAPQYPMWPTVMATYGRGVTSSPVQAFMISLEPSLTAMKAQTILEERRDVRAALQMFANRARLQRQVETLIGASPDHLNLDDHNIDDDSFDSNDSQDEDSDRNAPDCEGEPGPLAPHEMFPINPSIKVRSLGGRTGTPDEGFQEESLLDALDLDAVPTLTPEELLALPVNDVRNVQVVCDYVVLETAPPLDSVFV